MTAYGVDFGSTTSIKKLVQIDSYGFEIHCQVTPSKPMNLKSFTEIIISKCPLIHLGSVKLVLLSNN